MKIENDGIIPRCQGRNLFWGGLQSTARALLVLACVEGNAYVAVCSIFWARDHGCLTLSVQRDASALRARKLLDFHGASWHPFVGGSPSGAETTRTLLATSFRACSPTGLDCQGNLNLSRTIGDLMYKVDETLSPEKQMITADPDLRTLEITDEDEFIVLACDGVWNSLNSQEVGSACARPSPHIRLRERFVSPIIPGKTGV